MAVPEFQAFLSPVLGLHLQEPISRLECLDKISDFFGLTTEERAERTRGGSRTRVRDRVDWAITYLLRAGLLERQQQSVCMATELGRATYAAHPEGITRKMLRQFKDFRDFEGQTSTGHGGANKEQEEEDPTTPVERIESAAVELDAVLRAELLNQILKASPEFFEKLIIELMLSMGYGGPGFGRHLGKSSDGGVDGVINQDKLGLDSIYLQAKRYARDNSIGPEQLRAFSGALDEKRAVKGVFVTTSSFTAAAKQHVQNSPKSLVLIDGEQLTRMMIEYDVGVRLSETITLKRLDEDYFEE